MITLNAERTGGDIAFGGLAGIKGLLTTLSSS